MHSFDTATVPSITPVEPDSAPSGTVVPELVHNLRHSNTVLTLAVSPQHGRIYSGTQDGEIVAWSLSTFQQIETIQAHKRSVLSLFLSPDASLLFSSAGDPIINVWCPETLTRLYEIYSTHDVGDIFCTAYSAQHDTLYIGAQNSSIQWVTLSEPNVRAPHDSSRHPNRRNHRFFDSKAVGGTSTPRRNDQRWELIPPAETMLEIDNGAVRNFAHNGYVYCMLMAKGPTVDVNDNQDVLISGGGDGTIKLWSLTGAPDGADGDPGHGIEEIMTLGTDDAESVLSLAIDGSFLYAGKLDGVVELWDLDTAQRLRVIKAHDCDIMSLQMGWGFLWAASTNGWASKYSTAHYGKYRRVDSGSNVSEKYQCLSKWRAHSGKILASSAITYRDRQYYITGANDNDISVWTFRDVCSTSEKADEGNDALLCALKDFVSYKTISSRVEFAEDCRKGATYLGSLCKRLGGHVEMLSTDKVHNPVVYARFSGKKEAGSDRKKILFYGHYDVVAADNKKGAWSTDPFALKGTNGYMYGRGVSDNKGPILAALYAVTDLMQAQKLENDVVFLIEGEEEYGSKAFEQVVRSNKDVIGDVDYILLANSYWLDDEVPCLTYGLRGVLHATVCVESPRPDIHSGVDGSYMMDEPLSDLTCVLSKLKGRRNHIQIPGFYDGIPPMTPDEEDRYDEIASILIRRSTEAMSEEKLKQSLIARWREPNLTMHHYKVSGPDGSLISSHASANISLRLVPGQEVDEVAHQLVEFLEKEFAALGSQNWIRIKIDNRAEPWLGNLKNGIFRTLEKAVMEAWPDCFESGHGGGGGGGSDGGDVGDAEAATDHDPPQSSAKPSRPRKPLYIREGGSIPAIRFLEKEFEAPAAHLPCGQASDSAHLSNERMSLVNLVKAREIFAKVFERL
ncbi:hypothetical protein GMORB2_7652 [Geosmithia morbida]|uniref:Uncharacterized protein n=1 Tax=Geosmithia morbida TaxID=1094350 RepID=A0A9P5D519_9HYPO|nr:uncharacterized protein GMORB2_7652 [Geosmithia morbida]KAF4122059.1 hypothetical protein GMORB2_7652 [Geosmithia morbida]